MALIVEDGTGKTDADAYISVADADTYHAAHSNDTDWTAASTGEKEKGIRLATQYLDARYVGRWIGARKQENQALAWPRSGGVDSDGYTIDDDSLPVKLTHACAELALKVVAGDTLLADDTAAGTIKSKLQKVGSLEQSIEYLGGQTQYKKYRLVEYLLRELLVGTGQVVRG